jgi:hypothetical protein
MKSATPKKPTARNAASGKFEADPYADPLLMDQLVRYVRAISDLEPLLSGVVLMYKAMDGHEREAQTVAFLGAFLANLKHEAISSLAVDPEARREAKKKRLEAAHLGNLPLSEQQRVQRMAEDWLVGVPMTPAKLAASAPGVLDSIMRAAASLLVEGGPTALPARVPVADVVEAIDRVKGGDPI